MIPEKQKQKKCYNCTWLTASQNHTTPQKKQLRTLGHWNQCPDTDVNTFLMSFSSLLDKDHSLKCFSGRFFLFLKRNNFSSPSLVFMVKNIHLAPFVLQTTKNTTLQMVVQHWLQMKNHPFSHTHQWCDQCPSCLLRDFIPFIILLYAHGPNLFFLTSCYKFIKHTPP